MAVTPDANLGNAKRSSGATLSLTTAAAVSAGAKVFLLASWWSSTSAVISVSSTGGLTWSKDTQNNNGSGDRFAIFSADAPSGLASGTSLAVTVGGSADGGVLLGGASFLGVGTLDTTGGTTGTGTGWSSGSASNATDGALVLGGSGDEVTSNTTSTPVNGTELHDNWQTGAGQGFATGYLIASGTGSQSITGTFSRSSSANTGALVIYSPAAGGGGVTVKQLATLGVG